MNFINLTQVWEEYKSPLVKHSTMCAYRLILQMHLLPYFGLMSVIKEQEVQRFIIYKSQLGLAKKTIRDMVALLKSIVRYGRRNNLFEGEDWILEYPRGGMRKRLPILNIKHHKLLMKYLLEQPSSQNIGILLALCTGMRIGEVCALQWEHIDWVNRSIKVRETTARIYNIQTKTVEYVLSSPKTTNSFREIPMSNQLYRVLTLVKHKASESFIVGDRAQAMDPRAYRDFFGRLLVRLGIPKIVFHGLRHRDFYKQQVINRLNWLSI